jgi:uncharacterized protein YdcH (DUF465 family)
LFNNILLVTTKKKSHEKKQTSSRIALPKYPIKVQEITISHPHFRKFDEYHALDQKILRIRTGIERTTDVTIDKMKEHLLRLKAELYCLVKAK